MTHMCDRWVEWQGGVSFNSLSLQLLAGFEQQHGQLWASWVSSWRNLVWSSLLPVCHRGPLWLRSEQPWQSDHCSLSSLDLSASEVQVQKVWRWNIYCEAQPEETSTLAFEYLACFALDDLILIAYLHLVLCCEALSQFLYPASTSPAVNSRSRIFSPPPGHLWKDVIPLCARFMCKCRAALRPTGWPICLMTCQSS